ncbi:MULTISPECIES: YaeQ family protein [Anaeromyxobacter]|uniref:YaeQ family protein n=1 Tax=Anaeromyxobacter TaxID=161492 RepID=UPI001F5A2204|nr:MULTISPECIES: YaeQ family protein [unclassified Anaeromyxobacter]
MALPSTLHHFDLRVTHADTGVEATVALKVARHPSETAERLWLRVLAYAWQWREGIAFGPGLCEPDAPDVLAALPDGRTALVVRVGKPEPQRIERDVNGNAGARVAVLFESPRRLEAFLAEARERRLARVARADLAAVDPGLLAWLSRHEDRRARVGLTFVADHVYAELDGESADGPLGRASL